MRLEVLRDDGLDCDRRRQFDWCCGIDKYAVVYDGYSHDWCIYDVVFG